MLRTVRPTTYARITANPAIIREMPELNGRELGQLNYGEIIQILDDMTTWLAIPFSGAVAFIAEADADIIQEW